MMDRKGLVYRNCAKSSNFHYLVKNVWKKTNRMRIYVSKMSLIDMGTVQNGLRHSRLNRVVVTVCFKENGTKIEFLNLKIYDIDGNGTYYLDYL